MQKAILLVSFGSSYRKAREKTIDQIAREMEQAFANYQVYQAFTSHQMIAKVKQEEHREILDLTKALTILQEAGYKEVIVQPTFTVSGTQYREMVAMLLPFQSRFEKIKWGKPLLSDVSDCQQVVEAVSKECQQVKGRAIIGMGHGCDERALSFAALDYMFKAAGRDEIYVATMGGYPRLDHVIQLLKKQAYKEVLLVPLMLNAGYHARYDMLSKPQEAWKQHLEEAGYKVSYKMKGLGEYPIVRKIYIEHVVACMAKEGGAASFI